MICPICAEALIKEQTRYICRNSHSFDIAKKGYVNLFITQTSSDKRHGDDKLMVLARRDFLNKGFYGPLCQKITEIAKEHALSLEKESISLLDAGCGEGYYTCRIFDELSKSFKVSALAIDISKHSFICGQWQGRPIERAVASIFALPAGNLSCDILINIFAPESEDEFSRVLSDEGIFIKVSPKERHLIELKERIYEKVYENKPILHDVYEKLELVRSVDCDYCFKLNTSDEVNALFMMTPYYYKSSREDQARAKEISSLTVSASFDISVYKKRRD